MLRVETAEGESEIFARAVLDASGTWSTPTNGLPALGERDFADCIHYCIPDVLGGQRSRYDGNRTVVVGSGDSAANALLDLANLARQEPGTQMVWAVRGTDLMRTFGGGEADGLPAQGALGTALGNLQASGALELVTGFQTRRISSEIGRVAIEALDGQRIERLDEIVVTAGLRPDLVPYRELRLKLDPWLECTEALGPLIDPNLHSCGTVRPHGVRELSHPEPGFYTVGIKSYGRAPTFLLATGYEQVRSIAAFLAGDLEAAYDVQLDLPETGVCSSNLVAEPLIEASGGCCGGPAPAMMDTCCAADAEVRASGGSGCGCGDAPAVVLEKPAAVGCCGPRTT